MRVLVVDDEPALRESLARSLRFEGYTVATAADGAEAIERLPDVRPDALVVDVVMPRLDGVEVCRRLRDHGDRTPVLMLTARDAVRDRVRGLDAGADDYLVKPFAYEELLARLRAVLRRAGEMVGVVGPSGSGKSTLLNILGTLDRADDGLVCIDGYDVGELSDRELSAMRAHRIGFVFQQFFLAPGVTALDNVADGLLYTGLPAARRRDRARRTLQRVGLGDRLHHKAHELSGGQRQRVAVARALAGEPSLLLADEPTGALDSAAGSAVLALLQELHAAGNTIVVITHDHHVADALPRQVRILDGRLESDQPMGAAA